MTLAFDRRLSSTSVNFLNNLINVELVQILTNVHECFRHTCGNIQSTLISSCTVALSESEDRIEHETRWL